MPFSRFKDFRRFYPSIFAISQTKDIDPWHQFIGVIEEFNEICTSRMVCSWWIVADESMSAWRPRTTAFVGLPNISFIIRKPEPLGEIIN
jgi:hypothetical protein